MTQNFIVHYINESILRVNNNKPKGIITLFVTTIKCLKNQVDSDLETFAIICKIIRLLSPVMVF
jgi:hypothetical protein